MNDRYFLVSDNSRIKCKVSKIEWYIYADIFGITYFDEKWGHMAEVPDSTILKMIVGADKRNVPHFPLM